MRQKLGADVGKFLFGFWVKEPKNGASIDQWLDRLACESDVDRLWTGTFRTHWYRADAAQPLLTEVEAGLTLFEVKSILSLKSTERVDLAENNETGIDDYLWVAVPPNLIRHASGRQR